MRRDVFYFFVFHLCLCLCCLKNKNTWSDSIFAADVMGNSGMVECRLRLWDGVMEALMEGGAKPHNTVVLVLPQNQPTPSPQKIPTWNSLYFLHISVDPFESVRSKGWGVEELTFTKFPKRKSTVNLISALSLFQNSDLVFWQRNWEHKTIAASDWLPRGRGVKGVWQKLAVH